MRLASTTFIVLLVASGIYGQTSARENARATAELAKLRTDYIAASNEYKDNLRRLLILYQESAAKAKERLRRSEELRSQNLLTDHDVDESKRLLADAQIKIQTAQTQLENAEAQIAASLKEIEDPKNKTELIKQYRRSAAREPNCNSWSITVYRQEHRGAVISGFQITCKK